MIVIILIRAAGYFLYPRLVGEVPVYGVLESFFKGDGGFPAEFGFEFGGVNGVALVVASAVGDVGDELFGAAAGAPEFAVEEAAEEPDQLDVGPFVEAADVVRLAEAPVVENGIDGAGVVFYP